MGEILDKLIGKKFTIKIVDKLIKEQQIPDCILNNPEFKRIKNILDRDAPPETGCRIEGRFVSCEKIVNNSGSGLLLTEEKSKLGKPKPEIYGSYSYEVISRPGYEIPLIPEGEKADVKSVEFNIDITDKYYLQLIKFYGVKIPKSLKFEVLPNPESFKLKTSSLKQNATLDISQIIKVTQKTFSDQTSITHYDKNGMVLESSLSKLAESVLMPR